MHSSLSALDEKPPSITCPESFYVDIEKSSDTVSVDFTKAGQKAITPETVMYTPSSLSFTAANIGSSVSVQAKATNKYGNTASCKFQVAVKGGSTLLILCITSC